MMGLKASQFSSWSALASLSPSSASLLYSCWRMYLLKASMSGFLRVLIYKLNRGGVEKQVIRNSLLLL